MVRSASPTRALVESGLDNALEQLFITAEVGGLVAHHADDGTLHLGRRVEDIRLNGEQVLNIVPCLNKDRKDAALLIAGTGRHTQGYLMLNHAGATGELEVLNNFKFFEH